MLDTSRVTYLNDMSILLNFRRFCLQEFEKTRKLLDDSNGKLQELLIVHRELDGAYKQVNHEKEELLNRLEGGVGADGLPSTQVIIPPIPVICEY